jgi:hypothetical protein
MSDYEERMSAAASVDEVMALLSEYLRELKRERQNGLLPAHCRHMVLLSPADVQFWRDELDTAWDVFPTKAYHAGRTVLEVSRAVFGAAWDRLTALGYRMPRAPSPIALRH